MKYELIIFPCMYFKIRLCDGIINFANTVELQWVEHFLNHENMFETGVVRAIQCQSYPQTKRYLFDTL